MTEAEQLVINLFSEKYGQDLWSRFRKLDEEYNELKQAVEEYKNGTGSFNHVIDELSDVNAVKTHICGLFGISNDKLLIDAIIKSKVREHNPNYLNLNININGMEQTNIPRETRTEIVNKIGFTLDEIFQKVAGFHGFKDEAVALCKNTSRKREVVTVRQQYCTLAKELTDYSLSDIGNKMGERDHATVLHSCKTVGNLCQTDKKYRAQYFSLRNHVLGIE